MNTGVHRKIASVPSTGSKNCSTEPSSDNSTITSQAGQSAMKERKQALIQLTVAHSHVLRGKPDTARKLAGWALDKLQEPAREVGRPEGGYRDHQ